MKTKKHTRLREWQERCRNGNEKCVKCGDTRNLTVDHIVPVVILYQFTLNVDDSHYNLEENFQILCRYCNLMKGGRIDPGNPKTYSVLAGLMQRAKEYYIK